MMEEQEEQKRNDKVFQRPGQANSYTKIDVTYSHLYHWIGRPSQIQHHIIGHGRRSRIQIPSSVSAQANTRNIWGSFWPKTPTTGPAWRVKINTFLNATTTQLPAEEKRGHQPGARRGVWAFGRLGGGVEGVDLQVPHSSKSQRSSGLEFWAIYEAKLPKLYAHACNWFFILLHSGFQVAFKVIRFWRGWFEEFILKKQYIFKDIYSSN